MIEVKPGYDIEVAGGTAHWATQYVCRDTTMTDSDWTIEVPAFRLVPAA